MCVDKSKFDSYCVLKKPVTVYVADGQGVAAIGKGNIGALRDVFFVPSLTKNLISIMALDKLGYGTLFQDGQVFIRERGKELFSVVGVSDGSLYHDSVEFDPWLRGAGADDDNREYAGTVHEHVSEADLWHGRLCHCSYDTVKKMARSSAVTGILVKDNSLRYDHTCDA